MKGFCVIICAIFICLLSFPALTQAIEKKGKVEFSPLGGVFFKNDFTLKNENVVDFSGSYFAGGRLAIYLNSRVAIEGTFTYNISDGTIFESEERVIAVEDNAKSKAMFFGGSLIYHLGEIDFVPFLAFGAGIFSYTIPEDSSFPIDGNKYDLNIGGGGKYYMWEYLAFRADFRFHIILLGDQGGELPGYMKAFEFSGGICLVF